MLGSIDIIHTWGSSCPAWDAPAWHFRLSVIENVHWCGKFMTVRNQPHTLCVRVWALVLINTKVMTRTFFFLAHIPLLSNKTSLLLKSKSRLLNRNRCTSLKRCLLFSTVLWKCKLSIASAGCWRLFEDVSSERLPGFTQASKSLFYICLLHK